MKGIKIKIIIVLLLIIFFGLLILFGSRNIYEGIKTVQIQPKNLAPKITCTDRGCPVALLENYNKDFIPSKNKLTDKGKYFINVYYAYPDILKDPPKNISAAGLPIVYLYHNLPTEYKLYFSNSDDFGYLMGPRIYMQKEGESDINKFTPTKMFLQYAVGSAGLIEWNKQQKWSIPIEIQTKIIENDMTGFNELKIQTNVTEQNVKGNLKNKDGNDPSAKNVLPITYNKLLTESTIWIDARHGMYGPDYVRPIRSDTGKNTINEKGIVTKKGLGFLNLVTYYLDLP